MGVLGLVLWVLLPLASLDEPTEGSTSFAPGILGFEVLGATGQVLPDPPEPPTEADCLAQAEQTSACRQILAGEPIVDVTADPPRVAWIGDYPADEVRAALLWDLLFIIVYVALLALLARTGAHFRTVSTRRLAPRLMWAALAAGVLDVLENAFIWLAVAHTAGGPGEWAWRLAAAAAWAKWLVIGVVAVYGVGGLLSLFLDRRVREVLHTAAAGGDGDDADGHAASWTVAENDSPTLGIAISGGGIRAASITLGALQSLERGHALGWDAATDITSVSGGSYMAGGWSLARHAPETTASDPRPWSWNDSDQPGPEERHLEANLGYLLSNAPRGTSQDRMMREDAQPPLPGEAGADGSAQERRDHDREVAERRPAVVATVLTGIAINAAVFLTFLWVVSQPLGWFYRWYFALACPPLQETTQATADLAYCLPSVSRTAPSMLIWLGVGLGSILLWVVLAKRDEINRGGEQSPPAYLLILKVTGYGGIGLAALLGLLLIGLPLLIAQLWAPVEGNGLAAALVAILGALGSGGALFRILRKPLARFAPVIAGVLFGLLLLFVISVWALAALAAAPDARATTLWILAIVALLVVHGCASPEWWALAAFYRGKLRAGFATYRPSSHPPYARAYANGTEGSSTRLAEPDLSTLGSSPLRICAAAAVSGREVRTHYGIPALSITFSPHDVRLFAPLTGEGEWRTYVRPHRAHLEIDGRQGPLAAHHHGGRRDVRGGGLPRHGPHRHRSAEHGAGLRERAAGHVGAQPPVRRAADRAGRHAPLSAAGLPAQGVSRLPRPERPLPLRHRRWALGEHRAGRATPDRAAPRDRLHRRRLRARAPRRVALQGHRPGQAGVQRDRHGQPRHPPRRPGPLPRPGLLTALGDPRHRAPSGPGPRPRGPRRTAPLHAALVLQAVADPRHATEAAGLPRDRRDFPAGQHGQSVLPHRAVRGLPRPRSVQRRADRGRPGAAARHREAERHLPQLPHRSPQRPDAGRRRLGAS